MTAGFASVSADIFALFVNYGVRNVWNISVCVRVRVQIDPKWADDDYLYITTGVVCSHSNGSADVGTCRTGCVQDRVSGSQGRKTHSSRGDRRGREDNKQEPGLVSLSE